MVSVWFCPYLRRDVQVKAMEQTVSHAEKHLGHICSSLASYARKTAKLRDRADALVAHIFDFSSTEGPEFQLGLRNLAEDLAMVQDYRQAQVGERLTSRKATPSPLRHCGVLAVAGGEAGDERRGSFESLRGRS